MYKIFITPVGSEYVKATLYRESPSLLNKYKQVAFHYLPKGEAQLVKVGNIEKMTPRLKAIIELWGAHHGFTYSTTLIIDTRVDYKDMSLLKAMWWELKKFLSDMVWLTILNIKKRQAKRESKLFSCRYWIIVNHKGLPVIINKRQFNNLKKRKVISKHAGFTDLCKEALWDTGVV